VEVAEIGFGNLNASAFSLALTDSEMYWKKFKLEWMLL
jgi:hypothetical protein